MPFPGIYMADQHRADPPVVRGSFGVDRLGGGHGVHFQLFEQFVFPVYQEADAFAS
jgi:hypothetical protein